MADLGGLTAYLRADMRDLQTKLTRATRDIRNFTIKTEGFLRKNEKNFRKLGRAAAVAGAAIGAAMGLSVKAAADLEQGYIEVAKRTGMAGKELADFASELETLSVTMRGVSIKELQDIAATAGQLGIRGTKNILRFTKTMAKMGVATDLTSQNAALYMARLLNVMGEDINAAETFGSVMNELSNNTSAFTSNLADMTLRMGATAKGFGLTSAETLALAASMRDAGARMESGGSAMLKILEEMLKNVEGFTKVAGLEMEEFSKLIYEKPIEALKAILVELSKMDKIQMSKALDELGLSGVRVTPVMRGLAGTLENLDRNLKIANDEAERGTSLHKEYEAAAKGLYAKTSTLKTVFKEWGKAIGMLVMPEVKELAERAISLGWNMKVWVEENKELAKSMVIIAGKVGLAAGAVVGLGTIITGLRFTVLPVFVLFSGAIKRITEGLMMMSVTTLATVAGVVALAAIAYTLRAAWKQNLEAVKNRMQEFFDAWKDGFNWLRTTLLGQTIENIGIAFVDLFNLIITKVKNFINTLAGEFAGMWAWLKKVKDGVVDAWSAPTFHQMISDFKQGFKEGGEAFASSFVEASDKSKEAIKELSEGIKEGAEIAGIYLKAFGEAEVEHLGDLFAAVKAQVGDDMDALIAVLKNKMPEIAGLFEQLNNALPDSGDISGEAGLAKLRKAGEEIMKGSASKKDSKDFTRDKLAAYRSMFSEMGRMSQTQYKVEKELLGLQFEEYEKFIDDKVILDEWYTEQIRKLDIEKLKSSDSLTDGFRSAQLEMANDIKTFGEIGNEVAYAIRDSFANAFADMILDAKDFKEAATGFLKSIASAMVQIMSMQIATKLMLGLGFGSFGGGTPTMGGNTTMGNYAHGGGIVGAGMLQKKVPAMTFSSAPRLHAGLQPDEFPAVLQRGETVTPKGQAGGGANVEVNVINQTSSPVDAEKGQTEFDGEKYITNIVLKDIHGYGPMRNAIQGLGVR